MKVKKYYLVFKLSILATLEYRFDFLLHVFKYSAMVIMISFIWQAVARASHSELYTYDGLVTYFVMAGIIYSLSNFHPSGIEEDIRNGGLNKYLLKPISPVSYYFFYEAAIAILEVGLKTIIFIPLLYLAGYQLNLTLNNILLFLSFLPIIFIFSFNLLATISGLAFWITEASAVRWAVLVICRFLSGFLVPLSFLPLWWQNFNSYLPFPALGFTPLELVLNRLSMTSALKSYLLLIFWTMVMIGIRKFIWDKGLKHFEGVGI